MNQMRNQNNYCQLCNQFFDGSQIFLSHNCDYGRSSQAGIQKAEYGLTLENIDAKLDRVLTLLNALLSKGYK